MLCTVSPKFISGYCVYFTSNIGTKLSYTEVYFNRQSVSQLWAQVDGFSLNNVLFI